MWQNPRIVFLSTAREIMETYMIKGTKPIQYGLLVKSVFKGSGSPKVLAHMDDTAYDTISSAVEEARMLRNMSGTEVLGVFSIGMETGNITQIYNRVELNRILDEEN